jgi:septum formation protein
MSEVAGTSLGVETSLKGASGIPVILASGSRFRADMLWAAGVEIEIKTAGVDEASVRDSLKAEGATAEDVAIALAELKALSVSRKRPEAFVIGADQMLECNGVWFEKPVDRDHAAATLHALSGRTHQLISAVVVAKAGSRIWHATQTVKMTMRPLTPEYIEAYLETVGPGVYESVGAYQLEGLGAQLFSGVEGDYFTVLGLPLLPVLDFMRTHGLLMR